MIQRIQTLYYAVALLLAATPLLGYPLITFMENGDLMKITTYGNDLEQIRTINGETTNFEATLLHLGSWLLIALLVMTMLSYKKLKRQIMLGRIALVAYLVAIVLVLLTASAERSACSVCEMTAMTPTIWFVLFALGVIAILFANRGVKKDQKLLDSLNRLR